MEITREQLVGDFKAIGIREGFILGVHSSMKAIGNVPGGPQTVIDALLECLGESGTLLMPVFNAIQQRIDLKTMPSRVGLITEVFRTNPGVLRSVNATHSVAAKGKRAVELVRDHEKTTPLGENSPFHKLAQMGGWILHLGTEFNSCSIIHVAEVLAKMPYLNIGYPGFDQPVELVLQDGRVLKIDPPAEKPGDGSGFRSVQREMDRRGLFKKGNIGNAPSVMAPGQTIIDVALEMLKKDPRVLLCNKQACPVCPKASLAIKNTMGV